MPHRYTASHWSIEVADQWTAETREEFVVGERCEFVAVFPATNDALLRFTCDERGTIEAAKWVEFVGRSNRLKGRAVSTVCLGEFSGYAIEFNVSDECLRAWVLFAESIPLDVNYRCKKERAGRDYSVIVGMLSTLRLERTTCT